ncbi:heat shock protein 70, putative [Perkinsus marinus ATCC 50983]|uniref:Heat shock protein 70, putative n=1 Tax=Perkinsus marinus (strain ATCC 50983 / TXsc) TaxID=423536 RepID=C5KHQ5_PERM5|nr:heat shock protein 70, putative [Perkinsus marinus ATCC 50983]EER16117.1 heat shock protein 70, putative [Perkinsus marinus ATCC 50983]|eukprot:XP_002784321.1 heat shock protein 70, putative [Perkinsus marinus ATCC 50983]
MSSSTSNSNSSSTPSTPTPSSAGKFTWCVGVDFGTRTSVVASALPATTAKAAIGIDVNDVSNRATPSAVALSDGLRLTGEHAMGQSDGYISHLASALEDPIACSKRFECAWETKLGPITHADREGVELTPTQATAIYLKNLRSYASCDDAEVPDVMAIAVPNGYSDEAIDRLVKAAALATPNHRLVVLDHSLAIANAYQHKESTAKLEEAGLVLFVDVGYSHATATVVSYPEGKIVGSETNKSIGVFEYITTICNMIRDQYGAVKLCTRRGRRLLAASEKALKQLSMLADTTLELECFTEDDGDVRLPLTRAKFEDAAKSITTAIQDMVARVVAAAGGSLGRAELVGGGSRIPCVREAIAKAADVPCEQLGAGLDGSSCVAAGAAAIAVDVARGDTVEGIRKDVQLTDDMVDPKERELEEWMQDVHDKETSRRHAKNAFETYIYTVRDWINGDKKGLLPRDKIAPRLDKEELWFEESQYAEVPVSTQEYEEKLKTLEEFVQSEGEAFFKAQKEDRQRAEKELEDRAAQEQGKVKEDHDYRKMPASERLRMAGKNKEEGNVVFKAGNLQDAVSRYARAMQHLNKAFDMSPEQQAEHDSIALSCHLNTAQCYIKLATKEAASDKAKAERVWEKAVDAATEAVKIDDSSVKAHYRLAFALDHLGKFDEGLTSAKRARHLAPEDKEVVRLESRLETQIERQNAKAKKMYKKMFA